MLVSIIKQPNFVDTLLAMRLPMNGESSITHYKRTGLISEEDLKLLTNLVNSGSDHSKAIRGTWVTFLIKAPRYWWSEMDTYTVGKQTLSSTSTMHKITSRDLVSADFEDGDIREETLAYLNHVRGLKDLLSNTEVLIKMKRALPESFLQTRVVQINYQSLRNMYRQRKNHRLPEWKIFCYELKKLPYSDNFIIN